MSFGTANCSRPWMRTLVLASVVVAVLLAAPAHADPNRPPWAQGCYAPKGDGWCWLYSPGSECDGAITPSGEIVYYPDTCDAVWWNPEDLNQLGRARWSPDRQRDPRNLCEQSAGRVDRIGEPEKRRRRRHAAGCRATRQIHERRADNVRR